ncbi:MAG TPA: NAD-dependent epimerase/dehydratase family protein [Actinocrinis sp.]|uniref:NAD-dependent epimerase/dehydratase family protein n=1 Tax=Actinocrinis sp. TaxID=1920516 RepID=UPI002DDD7597|nr:NAD-dependent epimerase/dehydratase family protein [Actinocrinis sp.]HEV2345879.1 NAD-dependent epimerase/dehydratase family protein [Actinocrinis sp.]
MRVLVTGAFGYVGRAVTLRLLEAGHEVVALTRRRRQDATAGFDADGLYVVEADVRDHDRLRVAVDGIGGIGGIGGVCHLAALTRVRESFEQPDEYHAVNVGGTAALLESLTSARGGDSRPIAFVQASTAAIYGAPEAQPIAEDAVPAPTSPYGSSKLAAEQAVRDAVLDHAAEPNPAPSHRTARAIGAINLRVFNAAGSVAGFGDPDESRIIPRTLLAAAGLRPPLALNGDGSAVRDFVHVDDVARAYVLALGHSRAGEFRTYNVGATGASVREIIAAVESVTGRRVPIEPRPPQPEPPMLLADTARIRDELGWKPERSSLEEMVADTWTVLLRTALLNTVLLHTTLPKP